MDEENNFLVLKEAGDYFFANEHYDEASSFYESSVVYFDSPTAKFNSALAYIKLSEKIEEKRLLYLRKALRILNKLVGKWNNPLVNYYRGVVLSFLGKYGEASKDFDYVMENYSDFRDMRVSLDLSLSFSIPREKDEYVHDYLYNNDLVKLYDLLSDYSIGEKRERILKAVYGEEDIEMAKAREIKRLYQKVKNHEIKSYLLSDVALNQAVALLYMWGDENKTYETIKENSMGYFIDTRKLTPLTASILDQISGVKMKKKGMPFFILNELEDMKFLINALRALEKKGNPGELMAELIEFADKKDLKIPRIEKERIYRDDIYGVILSLIEQMLERIKRKSYSYYSKKESNSLLKAVIQSLPLPKKEKSNLLLSYAS